MLLGHCFFHVSETVMAVIKTFESHRLMGRLSNFRPSIFFILRAME